MTALTQADFSLHRRPTVCVGDRGSDEIFLSNGNQLNIIAFYRSGKENAGGKNDLNCSARSNLFPLS
jgi:hypothetical protein